MSIQQLHHRFCQYKLTFENLSSNTILWHKRLFNCFLEYSNVDTVKEVNKALIEDWIVWGKLERNWSPRTIRHHLVSLNVFLSWCEKESYIKENTAKKIPKPRLPKKIPKHLSIDQTERLLDWAKHYPYLYDYEKNRAVAIIAMFIYTGIRYKELLHLKLEDIDFENNIVHVLAGKGAKDRNIPLSPTLKGYLKPYLTERNTINPYSLYFFVSKRSHGKMSDKTLRRLIEKLKVKSKINFTPHMLRHTFATLMLEGGCDIFSLSKMMGHSNIKTTTIYLTATVSHLQSQICKHPLQ